MNRYYRVSVWTGPTLVDVLGTKAKECADLLNVVVGTEHLYADVEATTKDAAVWNFLAALQQQHGTDFGLRPSVLFLLAA